MNILVHTYSGRHIVRPDTTWENDSEDYFAPDYVESLTYSPVVFCRVCKPGRSVGERFVGRYYDSVNFGMLLYPENLIDGSAEGFAEANCIDHTSFLPSTLFPKEAFTELTAVPVLMKDGQDIRFIPSANESKQSAEEINEQTTGTENKILRMLELALCEASKRTFLRHGDLVAVELAPRAPLCSSDSHITLNLGDTILLDFGIHLG